MEKKLTLSERKRAAIVEAAIEEFRDKGYQAVSMDSLSARAGVSKRTVYNHFDSKEALFQEIGRQLFEVSAEMTSMSYQSHIPVKDQLLDFAMREIDMLKSERFRDLSMILFPECIHTPELVASTFELLGGNEQGLEVWIAAAVNDGALKDVDPAYASSQFLGLIKGCAFWPQLLQGAPVPDQQRCEQIASDATGMFLGYYAA